MSQPNSPGTWDRLRQRVQGWYAGLAGLCQMQAQPGVSAGWLDEQRRALGSPVARDRWRAAAALRGIRLRNADLELLGLALHDPEPFVRWEAAMTLRDVGGQAALSIIEQTLAGDDPAGLSTAAETIAELGQRGALPRLVELLRHRDPGVRASAAAAVGRLAAPEDEAAVQGLIGALADQVPGVRQVTAQALGRAGSATAAPALAARLAQEDEFRLVRRAAAWSLGRLGADPLAVEALTRALSDRDGQVRQLAAVGLGQIGHSDVIAALRPLTSDESDTGRGTVAAAAIEAIERIEARRDELRPPTPVVPVEHGEPSLDARKRRLGLVQEEEAGAPGGDATPSALVAGDEVAAVDKGTAGAAAGSEPPASAEGNAMIPAPATRRKPGRKRKPVPPPEPDTIELNDEV